MIILMALLQLNCLPVLDDYVPASAYKDYPFGPATDFQCAVKIGGGKGRAWAKKIFRAVHDNIHRVEISSSLSILLAAQLLAPAFSTLPAAGSPP